jgi:ceramide glucosyltransferase
MTLFTLCAIISIVGTILYLLQVGATCSALRRPKKSADPAGQLNANAFPAVSILKPLKGLDDNLFDNLASFCTQDYPKYEILFAVQDRNDAAYKVIKKVQEKFPDRDISIIVEKCSLGLNPKINNLIPAYKKSKHPYVLISDSNVMVKKDYLKEIMSHTQDPSVGLVSNLIRGIGNRSIGATLENLHLNSFIIGSVCFLDTFLSMPCVIGKSMLMKKEDLEALGGLSAFKDILAEDFIIGREMDRMGKKVVLSNYLINNVNEYWEVKRFINRHTRWAKLRWKIGGAKYISELLGNPVFIAALPTLFLGLSSMNLLLLGLVSLTKMAGDAIIGQSLVAVTNEYEASPQPPYLYFLAPLKDVLIGFLWFVPLLSSTVVWRGNRYQIGKDSRLFPCPETGISSWGYRITDNIRAKLA